MCRFLLTQQTPAAERHPAQEEWWTPTEERCPSSASSTQQDSERKSALQHRKEKTLHLWTLVLSELLCWKSPSLLDCDNKWVFTTDSLFTLARHLQAPGFVEFGHSFPFVCSRKSLQANTFKVRKHFMWIKQSDYIFNSLSSRKGTIL